VVNYSESYNLDSEEENFIAYASGSAWSEVDHTTKKVHFMKMKGTIN
jgi:hypothetical protein